MYADGALICDQEITCYFSGGRKSDVTNERPLALGLILLRSFFPLACGL